MVKHHEQLGNCMGKRILKSFFSERQRNSDADTSIPWIKGSNHLNYFLLKLLQFHILPQMKNIFFPSSPVLVQAFNLHNTWISHKDWSKIKRRCKETKKHSCSCNHAGAAAAVWCQKFSRAVKSDSKDKRTQRCYQHEKILYSGKEWLFLLREWCFSSLAKCLLFGCLHIQEQIVTTTSKNLKTNWKTDYLIKK